MTRRANILACLYFLGLLMFPLALAVAGVRPGTVENRALTTFPELDADAILNVDTYQTIDSFVEDRFPLRDRAIEGLAIIDYELFGDTTSPRVLVGRDDWLFLANEMQRLCDARTAVDLAGTFSELTSEFGVGSITVLAAPDKFGVYLDKFDRDDDQVRCLLERQERFRSLITAHKEEGYTEFVDSWTPIIEAAEADPDRDQENLVYLPHDSHWTPRGALLAAETLINHLEPGLWEPDAVVSAEPLEKVGDLTVLMGYEWELTFPDFRVQRAVAIEDVRAGAFPGTKTSGPAAVIPGTTVFIFDSQGALMLPFLTPYFEQLVHFRLASLQESELIAEMPHVDRVVWEIVERDTWQWLYPTDIIPVLSER